MKRKFISTTLVVMFLCISVTGILLFLIPHSRTISSTHTLFTFIFLATALVHILKNYKQLTSYIYNKKQKNSSGLYILIVIAVSLIFVLAIKKDLPLANNLYNFGNTLRNKARNIEANNYAYDIINIKNEDLNFNIEFEIKKGQAFRYPLFAAWLEDLDSNYISSAFVSQSLSNSVFKSVIQEDNTRKPGIVRRPEALPYWSHKRNILASDSLYVPLGESPDLDGVTGPTPVNNSLILTNNAQPKDSLIRILFEINQSFDWNEYYYRGRFKDDAIYNGPGEVGQPSLVYEAIVNAKDLKESKHYLMKLVGHGHHSGKNGRLFTDLSNITTAADIVDRVVIKVY